MQTPSSHRSVEVDISLVHLQAELARIDVLIQRSVQTWRLAGQDPADTFRGLYVSDDEIDQLLSRQFGSNWGQMVLLPPEEAKIFMEAEAEAANQAQGLVEQANRDGQSLRLVSLISVFDLSQFEQDVLLVCLAPTLDLRYERIYGYLQDDVTRRRPTVNLALDLLAKPGVSRLHQLSAFAEDAPLFKYEILKRGVDTGTDIPLLSQALQVDEAIVAWLLGDYRPHSALGPHATLHQPQSEANKVDTLLAGDAIPNLNQIAGTSKPPVAVFYGADQTAQMAAAKLLAGQLNRPVLMVDMAAVIGSEAPSLQALRIAMRDARLTKAIPCLLGWDACLTREGDLSPNLLTELSIYPDLVIVVGQQPWQAKGISRTRTLFWLEFPMPTYPRRLMLWTHFLENLNPIENQADGASLRANDDLEQGVEETDIDIEALAGQFILTTGQIRDTVASAKDMAAQRGDFLQNQDMFLAARTHSNPRLAALARKIVPRYEWQDIVLPVDQRAILHEIVATVRGRPLVLEQWGVGQKLASSAAVTVLFAGDPGTGKTMAAEVIARELNLDLYKIDLSTMISKYIGETEKNLEKIFSEAESSNAILFFDEADAIFGKRSEVKDAHDRYANIEVSYLLQRMEAYDGVTILATNLRANLDEAFTRRLQFAVDFPFPEKEDRLRIWQTLFPVDVPRAANLDFTILANRFKLAGGNIRNIIVSAAFQAAADGGQVTMQHLMHGTRRELQKMGRLIGEDDLKL